MNRNHITGKRQNTDKRDSNIVSAILVAAIVGVIVFGFWRIL